MKKRTITDEELNKILEKHKKWVISFTNGGERANLSDSDLSGAVLRYAKLQCADLQRANLQGAMLQRADLQFIDLKHANLRKTNLHNANLLGANLQCADLKDAYLTANLKGANLSGANLEGADLRYANLRGANLQYANLSHSKLDDANFKHSIRPWLITANHIGGRFSEILYFADKDNVRCGCWNDYLGGTLAEFKARVDKTYPADSGNKIHQRYRIEYLSAIKMFESMRNAYLESAAEEKNID